MKICVFLTLMMKSCYKTEIYEPRNVWIYKNPVHPIDAYFGLPLWLTRNFRGNNFWAYNHTHLTYLKQYISADLRERNSRLGWTMVEKLPVWVKSAKNRDKLVKLVTALEIK